MKRPSENMPETNALTQSAMPLLRWLPGIQWQVQCTDIVTCIPALQRLGLYVKPHSVQDTSSLLVIDFLEYLNEPKIAQWLEDLHKCSAETILFVIQQNRAKDQANHTGYRWRDNVELSAFTAGYRKHPLYYRFSHYEELNNENGTIYIALEKVPQECLAQYPLSSLQQQRGLHMDMTRDSGERSDAHIIRYQLACASIKPCDRVLDTACGLGYGSHLLRQQTKASHVLGIDGSEFAIDYANKAFPIETAEVCYMTGFLPETLENFSTGSFDVIVCFETLEHVANPKALLIEFERLLVPGGRIVASVPNDWSDETGEDPNPHHFHVYTLDRLSKEMQNHFIIEQLFAQSASQKKSLQSPGTWLPSKRELKSVELTDGAQTECEWWLITAMKSPLASSERPYKERTFANLAESGHPSVNYAQAYENPWLIHAMVNIGYRLKNAAALEALAAEVMRTHRPSSNDYAAALCVKAYRLLDHSPQKPEQFEHICTTIDQCLASLSDNPMSLRWRVSLLFVYARLTHQHGNLEKAQGLFALCGSIDVRAFGIHLATKTTEALYQAGKLSLLLNNFEQAKHHWQQAMRLGDQLLQTSVSEITINVDYPNTFHHGDGIREYALAWDNLAKCANGLHWLNRPDPLSHLDQIEMCSQTELAILQQDLINTLRLLSSFQQRLNQKQLLLNEQSISLQQTFQDLIDRTHELVETRANLVDRTQRLETLIKNLKSSMDKAY